MCARRRRRRRERVGTRRTGVRRPEGRRTRDRRVWHERRAVAERDVGVGDRPPPGDGTSDITTMFCPFGPTSIMSMSWPMPWLTPERSTSTSVITPVSPLTVIDDGYGVRRPHLVRSSSGRSRDPVAVEKSIGAARMPTSLPPRQPVRSPSLAAAPRLPTISSGAFDAVIAAGSRSADRCQRRGVGVADADATMRVPTAFNWLARSTAKANSSPGFAPPALTTPSVITTVRSAIRRQQRPSRHRGCSTHHRR